MGLVCPIPAILTINKPPRKGSFRFNLDFSWSKVHTVSTIIRGVVDGKTRHVISGITVEVKICYVGGSENLGRVV